MKMTSFENFSNVSRICQGILKTVEVTHPMLQRRPNRMELRTMKFVYPNFMEIPKMLAKSSSTVAPQ